MKSLAPLTAKLDDHNKGERDCEASRIEVSIQGVTMAATSRRSTTPPSAEAKSLMMNRFRIDLGFLPQHLPQQIAFGGPISTRADE
jgi:hypothetical protein